MARPQIHESPAGHASELQRAAHLREDFRLEVLPPLIPRQARIVRWPWRIQVGQHGSRT